MHSSTAFALFVLSASTVIFAAPIAHNAQLAPRGDADLDSYLTADPTDGRAVIGLDHFNGASFDKREATQDSVNTESGQDRSTISQGENLANEVNSNTPPNGEESTAATGEEPSTAGQDTASLPNTQQNLVGPDGKPLVAVPATVVISQAQLDEIEKKSHSETGGLPDAMTNDIQNTNTPSDLVGEDREETEVASNPDAVDTAGENSDTAANQANSAENQA